MNNPTATTPFPEARVLVVDDEEGVRSVLARFLDLLGYRADEAASGHQALEMLERTPYDVIVLDIRLPGMDGVEVMHRARQVRPDLPIIFLTGHATLKSAVAAVKARATDYLFKPASTRDLATAIADALQQRAQGKRPRELTPERFLHAGSVTVDRKRRLAIVAQTGIAGSFNARLTASETALLIHLMQHPDIVLSCGELARSALDYDVSDGEARSIVCPHICRLRKKIEPDPTHPRLIHTAPSKGYVFRP
jgi:two-component system alkaline phosphatase synthesis response regulator PhoP